MLKNDGNVDTKIWQVQDFAMYLCGGFNKNFKVLQ